MTSSIEDIFKILAWVGIPMIGGVVALMSTLWSIKADLRRIEATIDGKLNGHEDRISRLERNTHDLRSDLLSMRLHLVKKTGGDSE